MRVSLVSSVLALSTAIVAQTDDVFEAPDLNITAALVGNGVNISAIPELAALVERTLLSGCSIAVGQSSMLPKHPADHRFSATP